MAIEDSSADLPAFLGRHAIDDDHFAPNAVLLYVPTGTGAHRQDQIARFLAANASSLTLLDHHASAKSINKQCTASAVIEEKVVTYRHDAAAEWLLPNVGISGKKATFPIITWTNFVQDASGEYKITSRHVYWDSASLLAQLDVLPKVVAGGGMRMTLPILQSEAAAMTQHCFTDEAGEPTLNRLSRTLTHQMHGEEREQAPSVDLHGNGRSSTRLNRSHIGGAPSQVFPSAEEETPPASQIPRDARRYESHFSLGDKELKSTQLAEDTDMQLGRGKKHAPERTNQSSIDFTDNTVMHGEEVSSGYRRDRNASHLEHGIGGLAGALAEPEETPRPDRKVDLMQQQSETTYDEDRAIGNSGKAIKAGRHNQSHFQLGGGITDDGPMRPSSRYSSTRHQRRRTD